MTAWQTYKYATQYFAVLSAPSPICWRFSTQSSTLIESEIIDMFGFEWNEKEEREALLEAGEARGEARGRINTIRDLLSDGIVTIEALKASGRYSPEELAAMAKP